MFKDFKKNKKGGYTIIETMVAISVFLIVITIGMGALLNTSSLHNKSSNMRSIMDSLSFVMDDMSKNLRTGSKYYCVDPSETFTYTGTPHNCNNGKAIGFTKVDENNIESKFVYSIEDSDSNGKDDISKSTNGSSFSQLTPTEVSIDYGASGFYVFGAKDDDTEQPFVIIRLVGSISYKGTSTPFSLQTSISQRLRDVPAEAPL